MDVKEYARKTFTVQAVEVTLSNYNEVAQWCGGEVIFEPTKMLGTTTDLPAILLKGNGANRGKEFKATLGSFVVELRGSFRCYRQAQFWSSFEELSKDGISLCVDVPSVSGEVPILEEVDEAFAGEPQSDGATAIPAEWVAKAQLNRIV